MRRAISLWGGIALLAAACSKDSPSPEPTASPQKASTDGALELDVERWSGDGAPSSLSELRGCVAVVRFWTNTCPYCRRSMPVLQRLADELKEQPVRFLGLYHPKPKGRENAFQEAIDAAEGWGVTFPIGYDRTWKTLDTWWLSKGSRRATSATFVLDHRGEVRHVHPGPELSSAEEAGKPYEDYVALEKAVRDAIGQAPGCTRKSE